MNKKKILFVADWPDTSKNVEVLQELLNVEFSEDYEWEVWSCKRKADNSKLYRWYSYFKGAVYIIQNRKKYHAFLIWQQMVGFILFEILSIFRFTISNIFFNTFLYNPKNFFKYFKSHMVKNALKHTKGIIWLSTGIADQVKDDFPEYKHKIYSAINPIMDVIDTNLPVQKEFDDPYFRNGVYSAGRSSRDFNIVIRAFRNTDVPVTIVCPDNYPITEPNITSNIRIIRFSQISHEQYYALAGQAFCILISVDSEKSPCGQLMINFAMENSKPIIVTDSFGARDYIINNVNGILFKLGQADEIRKAYERLKNDEEFRDKIVKNANETAEKMHPRYFIKKIINIMESNQQFEEKKGRVRTI